MNSVEQINESKKNFIIKKINLIINKNKLESIGVIGFTFKEDTKVTDESQYEKIMNKLKVKKINVFDENIKYLKIDKNLLKKFL